jgi:hypothetical protein
MPKNLQQVAAFPAKDIKITGMRIAPQRLLNLQGETVHPASHVRRTGRQPDANPRRRNNHLRSTVITRRRVTRPTSCPTLIDVPSGSVISILPSGACSVPFVGDGLTWPAPSPFAGSLIACTGKKTGGDSGLRTPRRPGGAGGESSRPRGSRYAIGSPDRPARSARTCKESRAGRCGGRGRNSLPAPRGDR